MDLFCGSKRPAFIKKAVRVRPAPPHDYFDIQSGGLFDLTEQLCESRFLARFHSGASTYYDALGLVRADKDVGTVASLLNVLTVQLLRRYVEAGGRWFIDSGAFGAFQAWKTGSRASPILDFEKIFDVYDCATRHLSRAATENIWLVMPDIIGDHGGSLDLLSRHRDRVRRYIGSGANVIVPIQQGPCRAGETAERVFDILGSRKITLGIPSKAAAMQLSDIATIRHNRVHVLGRCALSHGLYMRAYAFLEHNLGATLTCDGNRIRARLQHISFEHSELIKENEGGEWSGCFDDTELAYEVAHVPNWMTRTQVSALARALGVHSKPDIERWIAEHKATGLSELIDELDPDGWLLTTYAIPTAFGKAARVHMSARLRADAVAYVFSE